MSWVWDNSPYDGAALLVHLALADYANDEGICWPSQATLAAKARCTDRYVRSVTARMVEAGFLEIAEPSNGVSSHKYRLLSPRNSVPPRNSETPSPELHDNLTGTLPPKNHQEPSRTKCPYCHRVYALDKPHACSAANMLMR